MNLQLTFRDGGAGDAGDPYTGLDRFGRLVETLWKQPSTGDSRVKSAYGRNQVGGVKWRKDEQAHSQSPAVATEDNYYWYDGLQQVKERQRGDLTAPSSPTAPVTDVQQEEDFTYDETGNWAAYDNSDPVNEQTRTHNEANEITDISSAPGEVEPGYDAAGNMLTLPKAPGTSTEQYDLVWDAWNRLVQVKDGETTVASYTYDGLTRRLTKATDEEVRHYYYNKDWRAVEERVEVEDAPPAVDRQYVWGLRDRWDLVRRKRSVEGTLDEVLYVLRDYLDPVAICDDSGDVVERYAYDAFGGVRILAPDYSDRTISAFDWDFLFHGEFQDADTKLYNYGYRYYDTGLGRWLSRDPIGETSGSNVLIYIVNAPLNSIDALGLFPAIIDPESRDCAVTMFVGHHAECHRFTEGFNLLSATKPCPYVAAGVIGCDLTGVAFTKPLTQPIPTITGFIPAGGSYAGFVTAEGIAKYTRSGGPNEPAFNAGMNPFPAAPASLPGFFPGYRAWEPCNQIIGFFRLIIADWELTKDMAYSMAANCPKKCKEIKVVFNTKKADGDYDKYIALLNSPDCLQFMKNFNITYPISSAGLPKTFTVPCRG